MKIGVFDSGVGGLTVLAELRKALPEASFVYFGDTANVPYGTKSAEKIESLCRSAAQRISKMGIDALVVACNTASSLALGAIQEELGALPVFGVVEPGVGAALQIQVEGPILVLATRATVRSHAYLYRFQERMKELGRDSPALLELACPLLVPLIEEGWIDHSVLHLTLNEYLGAYAARFSSGIAVLGCTHFPWIQAAVEKALPGWVVVNSAQTVAQEVSLKLVSAHLPDERSGEVEWFFSDAPAVPDFARQWIEDTKRR